MKIEKKILNKMFDTAGIQKETLYNGLRQMGIKHLKNKKLKEQWNEANPTRNYCYVVCELVYQYLSPKGSSAWCLDIDGEEEKHWFVKWDDGTIVDLSAEQFDSYKVVDYTRAKRRYFQTPSPSKRTRLLAELCGVRNIPYSKTDVSKLKHNKSFDEIQQMTWEDFAVFVDGLRKEILNNWDNNNTPPMIGKSIDEIKIQFNQLKDYPIDKMFIKDKNYPQYLGMIKNFSKTGSACSQFFPSMLKTRINGLSMYDWFQLSTKKVEFRRQMVRSIRLDGMYSYSKCLKSADCKSLGDWIKKNEYDFWLEPTADKEGEILKVELDEIKRLESKGIINDYHFRNVMDDEGTHSHFNIRYYRRNQKLYPNIIQVYRLGFGQVPVNFPPLTARLIYERFLGEDKQDSYNVFDMCSGWGGRLLGALSSNLKIHYVGTDVNSNNFGLYEELAKFYNENCNGNNTFDIFKDGCEVISENKRFKKYKGKLDLCFTSPPYFSREVYSDDDEQSCYRYPNYNDWLKGFMLPTILTCNEFLKPNKYMIINIADVKIKDKEFIPLEQDTISIAVKNGFKFIGTIGMVMTRMIGLNPKNIRNNWFDYDSRTYYKIEPILIFKKNG